MFENTLIASRRQRGSKVLLPAALLAVFIHLFVLSGYLAAQMWSVGEVAEPFIQVSFFYAPPLPPPPPAPPRKAPTAPPPAARPQPPPVETVQPVALPELPPEPGPGSEEGASGTGTEGQGEENGLPWGVDGGVWTDEQPVMAGTPVEEPAGPALPLAGIDATVPRILRQVVPDYPEAARRAKIQGLVFLEAVIRKDGTVGEVRVLRSLGPLGCDEAAAAALREWRFEPGRMNGRPVDVIMHLSIRFVLQ